MREQYILLQPNPDMAPLYVTTMSGGRSRVVVNPNIVQYGISVRRILWAVIEGGAI
jgi:hypothetical protein